MSCDKYPSFLIFSRALNIVFTSALDQNKLTFNITYYPVFQNVRNILQELHILLTPDKEHKKVFQDIPIVGFRNGKSLKITRLERSYQMLK